MKKAPAILAMILCASGCATSTTTVLQVSGDGGQGFSARVETRNQRVLTVATVTKENQPHEVLHTNGEIVTCDLRKEDKSEHIVAEVMQGGRVMVRVEARSGTEGVRIEKVAGGEWKRHTY